jgi:glycerol uptake facilitator-like aquaporin
VVRRLGAEAIGTFFLVFIGPGSVMVDAYSGGAVGHVGVALAFAFVVIAMVFALGHLSGAHINPAVTIAFWSVGRFPAVEVVPYVLAQCAGATAASLAPCWGRWDAWAPPFRPCRWPRHSASSGCSRSR